MPINMTPNADNVRHPQNAIPSAWGGDGGPLATVTPRPNGIETHYPNEGSAERTSFNIGGRAYCAVQVEDGNGNFQERIAEVTNGPHSFITQILVGDLRLKPRLLSPPLRTKSYLTPIGLLQLTQYVEMVVRVPLYDIAPTKLALGVLDVEGILPGPGFILGNGFHNKTGRVLLPPQATDFGTTRREQADPGEHGVSRLPPEPDGVRPNGIPLLAHAAVDNVEDQKPDVSGIRVDPPDLNRLNLPGFGPGPHTGPSRSTSVVGGMSLSTTRDPIRSSAPTSVTPEETSPIAKDTSNDFSAPQLDGNFR
ncbi:hypothetical protein CSOJ01_01423 [Colletotrichum sojae]|uniref:Uncharacterized protein n=1 Tax=Colletotrichum sojae TaxID=2175907 RepID=A0A8H6JV26_9PEZI|nr:hypothetical protein CSOJ01_01423 [Colletotrichum sojae]